MGSVAGKKVIITGGGRGIGKKIAVDLLARGAKPFVVDVVQENLDALKKETGIPGAILDVTDEAAIEKFFESYVSQNGAPDVLINNAGITADGLFIKKKDAEVSKFPLTKLGKGHQDQSHGQASSAREKPLSTWSKAELRV